MSGLNQASNAALLQRIKLLALDVDGVLTDGGFWWGGDGEEFKRFCFHDIMGMSLARKAGIVLALVSGEDSPLVKRIATKMTITDVFAGCKDKGRAVLELMTRYGLGPGEICFMGDDVNDLSAMEAAGLGAAPANAHPAALAAAKLVTVCKAGNGAVRELVDAILAAKNHPRP